MVTHAPRWVRGAATKDGFRKDKTVIVFDFCAHLTPQTVFSICEPTPYPGHLDKDVIYALIIYI